MQVSEAVEIRRQMDPAIELGIDMNDLMPSIGGLSCREIEVLRHLAKGEQPRQIAEQLYVSVHTARNHVRTVLEKTNTHSTLEAVVTAVRLGLLSVDELGRPGDSGSESAPYRSCEHDEVAGSIRAALETQDSRFRGGESNMTPSATATSIQV